MEQADGFDDSASLAAPKTLAEKLDRCFTTMHPKDRGPYTYKEVSAGMAKLGVSASYSYLWHLRKGERTNPTLDQLQALAKIFGISAAYFVADGEEVDVIDAQMAVVLAMRNPNVRDVAVRAGALSPAGLRAVAGILREIEATPGFTQGPRVRQKVADDDASGGRRSGDPAGSPRGRRSDESPNGADQRSD